MNPEQDAAMQEILQLEDRRARAIVSKDHATLRELLAPDHVYIHCSGRIDTFASYIDRVLTGKSNYHSLDFSNVQIKLLGDTAIVWGDVVMDMRLPSQPRVLVLRFSNIWSRIDGRWLNVHWIAAPNTQPPTQPS
ncbi:nuclear transport factor 2 family protein [Ottowia thiooxydans]|uniref:nuclear transport factor 2 family protein n=1 Tax=Ottowia thiooxydans TaxID=219182 RepID=UPI0006843823|nr:nuclear transport factor 2 family protein [Ottowia thiooxydans]